jgi:hypothetical protein
MAFVRSRQSYCVTDDLKGVTEAVLSTGRRLCRRQENLEMPPRRSADMGEAQAQAERDLKVSFDLER